MHLHFPFSGIIIHKKNAACNRKSRKTPEKAVFFLKNQLTSAKNRAILGITCEWVLSFCALFASGAQGAGIRQGGKGSSDLI